MPDASTSTSTSTSGRRCAVMSFLYNLMSDEWKDKVEFIVLLSPSYNSDFKIHFFDQVGFTCRRWPYDVLHEIMKIEEKKNKPE
jgi:type IV secretory pathway VirJ component